MLCLQADHEAELVLAGADQTRLRQARAASGSPARTATAGAAASTTASATGAHTLRQCRLASVQLHRCRGGSSFFWTTKRTARCSPFQACCWGWCSVARFLSLACQLIIAATRCLDDSGSKLGSCSVCSGGKALQAAIVQHTCSFLILQLSVLLDIECTNLSHHDFARRLETKKGLCSGLAAIEGHCPSTRREARRKQRAKRETEQQRRAVCKGERAGKGLCAAFPAFS